jgi:hypothetical protein
VVEAQRSVAAMAAGLQVPRHHGDQPRSLRAGAQGRPTALQAALRWAPAAVAVTLRHGIGMPPTSHPKVVEVRTTRRGGAGGAPAKGKQKSASRPADKAAAAPSWVRCRRPRALRSGSRAAGGSHGRPPAPAPMVVVACTVAGR